MKQIQWTLYRTIIAIGMLYANAFAQGTIHPMFGTTYNNDSTEVQLVAIDQINGVWTVVDSSIGANIYGRLFANDPVNQTLFFYTSDELVSYRLPDVYSPFFSGLDITAPITPSPLAIEYFPLEAEPLYGIYENTIHVLNDSTGGIVSSAATLPYTLDSNTISSAANIDESTFYASSKDSIFIYDIGQDSLFLPQVLNTYNQHRLVFHQTDQQLYSISSNSLSRHALISINTFSGGAEEIVPLPSCVNCADTFILYDKEAIVIDEERNWLMAVREEIVQGVSTHYLTTVDINIQDILHDVPLPGSLSNLYFTKAEEDLVFPGDANHDKVVNVHDLLSIGLAYNAPTIPRTFSTTRWVGQYAESALETILNADMKHVDANGDGQINEIDILSIQENYGAVHNSESAGGIEPSNNTDCAYPYSASYPSVISAGEIMEIRIQLNTPEPIYGLAFSVEFDNRFVQEGSFELDFGPDPWFGTIGNDFLAIQRENHQAGRLDVGITGIDHQNRFSNGEDIITIIWIMEEDILPIIQGNDEMDVPLHITNVTVISKDGVSVDACGIDTSMKVVTDDYFTGIHSNTRPNDVVIYPNPSSSGNLYINLKDKKQQNVHIDVVGVDGKLIFEQEILNASGHISLKSLAKGVYFIRIHTDSTIITRKVLILHE